MLNFYKENEDCIHITKGEYNKQGELIKLGDVWMFYSDGDGYGWTMNDLTQINDKLYGLNNGKLVL